MLPYLAQGAAMAIEEAAALAQRLADAPDDRLRPCAGMSGSGNVARRAPSAQRAAMARSIHGRGGSVSARARAQGHGLQRLLTGYDWLYGWKAA